MITKCTKQAFLLQKCKYLKYIENLSPKTFLKSISEHILLLNKQVYFSKLPLLKVRAVLSKDIGFIFRVKANLMVNAIVQTQHLSIKLQEYHCGW